jgi:putative tricarboxylic transport membrane protein
MISLPLHITYLSLFLLGTGYLIGSLDLPLGSMDMPGPGVFPLIVAVLMMGLSILNLLGSLWRGEKPGLEIERLPQGKDRGRVLSVIAVLVAFVGLLSVLGYAACGAGLMLASLRILGMRSWIKIIIISAVTTAVSTYLFSILGVPFPRGNLF